MKKNILIAACVAGLACSVTGAYAQSGAMSSDQPAMSKDAMGHDEMAKDQAMKKSPMKKPAMKKKDAGAMSHDSMGKPMQDNKMSPSNSN